MDKRQLAENLAVSLSNADWSKHTLQSTLKRRLPPAMHVLADPISSVLVGKITKPYAPAPKVLQSVLSQNPSFQRLFKYCQKNDVWPAPDLAAPVMAPTNAFSTLELPQLTTVDALADWVGLSLEHLAYHSDPHNRFEEHGDMAVNHYHYHVKPKSTGGQRVIEAPKKRLKTVQRRILTGILNHVPSHPDTFGFVKGRNCLDGAARHAGEQAVLCFDLKDFFPSIGYTRVFGLFRCLGYPHTVARHLSAFCTNITPSRIVEHLRPEDRPLYKTPHLPQGAPTSPSLANLLAHTLDHRLSALARSLNANFSRYADDLAFSGDPFIAATLMRTVPGIVEEEGFVLNIKKTRVTSASSKQCVTGVVVNQHLNIDRKTFDRLKAIIHACGKPDDTRLNDPAFCASLVGKLDWCERVNPGRGQKLKALLSRSIDCKFGRDETASSKN